MRAIEGRGRQRRAHRALVDDPPGFVAATAEGRDEEDLMLLLDAKRLIVRARDFKHGVVAELCHK
eukprot:6219590-Lingulodinium_polyedra.AAC.1